MTVIIAGAGIAGLSLGISLQSRNIPFQIFEQVSEIKPLGVGINLQPHAVRELVEMGLGQNLAALGIKTREVAYFSVQGGHIWSEPRGEYAGYHWPQYSVHRGKFQLMLRDALIARGGANALKTGHKVTAVRDTVNGVEISFLSPGGGNGRAAGTVCVAAEGIHSSLRAQFYRTEQAPKWGGTIMWRGITVAPAFLSGATMAMIGTKAQKFVVYPIADLADGRQLINWIADLARPPDYAWNKEDWNRAGKLDDFLPRFAGWDFDWLNVPELIKAAGSVYEYPMVDRDPVARWTFGNTTLLGDAAHAMYPIGSNGASQAILDGRVLTQCFVDFGPSGDALNRYESIRRPAVNPIVLANRGDGPDKILDEVATLAPDGFTHISEVLSQDELQQVASRYKSIAGFDVEDLNKRAALVG